MRVAWASSRTIPGYAARLSPKKEQAPDFQNFWEESEHSAGVFRPIGSGTVGK